MDLGLSFISFDYNTMLYIVQELLKLRKKITSTVQVLTHLKEKLQYVQAENQVQKRNLRDVEVDVAQVCIFLLPTFFAGISSLWHLYSGYKNLLDNDQNTSFFSIMSLNFLFIFLSKPSWKCQKDMSSVKLEISGLDATAYSEDWGELY